MRCARKSLCPGAPRTLSLTTRVKGEFLGIQEEKFNSLDVKVITEDAVVYLMGLITVENAAIAIDHGAQGIRGEAGRPGL